MPAQPSILTLRSAGNNICISNTCIIRGQGSYLKYPIFRKWNHHFLHDIENSTISKSIKSYFYLLRKFILPSILTSDNTSTWLATRKNDNDLAKSAANKSNENQSGSIKINQDDNAKWLLKPLNKSETDLVTLTGRLTKIIFWNNDIIYFDLLVTVCTSPVENCTINLFN